MSMETYRVEITDNPEAGEVVVEVYDIDDMIAVAERAPYEQYGLEAASERDAPGPRTAKATADVTTLDVQFTRVDGATEVRLLGDREELVAERLTDAEWGLVEREE